MEQAIDAPSGLQTLLQPGPTSGFLEPAETLLVNALVGVIYWHSTSEPGGRERDLAYLTALGKHIVDNPATPWAAGITINMTYDWAGSGDNNWPQFDLITNLGGFALSLILIEAGITSFGAHRFGKNNWLGPLNAVQPYAARRFRVGPTKSISELPVPEQFKQVFWDWAEGKVNFT